MSRTKELPFSSVGKYIQLVGLVLACGTLVFSYMKKERLWLYADTPLPDTTQDDGAVTSSQTRKDGITRDFPKQVQQAIVTVTTSWGQGTGFFLKEHALITGQHLVKPDLNRIVALQDRVAQNKELLQLEEEKLANYQARLSNMRKKKEKKALSLLITEREKYLNDWRAQQEKDEQVLAQQQQARQQPRIQIILANGVEHQASLQHIHGDYGLALLSLPTAQENSVLESAPMGDLLRLGDLVVIPETLFGNDKEWITGVFAGYRRIGQDNRMYLQIKAKLSKGKYGSPVLDSTGAVRAVVSKAGQGPVFAVPIEKVRDAFAGFLH
jgi:hypothetical protein